LKITPSHAESVRIRQNLHARLEQLSSAGGNAKRPATIRLEKALLRSLEATLDNAGCAN